MVGQRPLEPSIVVRAHAPEPSTFFDRLRMMRRHTTTPPGQSPRAAVSAVIARDGKILLVKRGCEPNMGLWSLPGGGIELGETAREAVAREVREETALIVEPGKVAGVFDVISEDGGRVRFHYVVITFFAEIVSGELDPGSDAADAQWIDLARVKELPTTDHLAEHLSSLGLPV